MSGLVIIKLSLSLSQSFVRTLLQQQKTKACEALKARSAHRTVEHRQNGRRGARFI
jgi:hypothetical protein